LCVNVTAAVRGPAAVGANLTVTVQVAPAARLAGQWLATMAKSPALAPPRTTDATERGLPAGFASLSVTVALSSPTRVGGNVATAGERTGGAGGENTVS
jgi:hypothetical protein